MQLCEYEKNLSLNSWFQKKWNDLLIHEFHDCDLLPRGHPIYRCSAINYSIRWACIACVFLYSYVVCHRFALINNNKIKYEIISQLNNILGEVQSSSLFMCVSSASWTSYYNLFFFFSNIYLMFQTNARIVDTVQTQLASSLQLLRRCRYFAHTRKTTKYLIKHSNRIEIDVNRRHCHCSRLQFAIGECAARTSPTDKCAQKLHKFSVLNSQSSRCKTPSDSEHRRRL